LWKTSQRACRLSLKVSNRLPSFGAGQAQSDLVPKIQSLTFGSPERCTCSHQTRQ
jgi:hypothetical protein